MSADDATALTAIAALVLSIFNSVWTLRISKREYSLALTQDILKWSTDVVQLFRDTESAIDLDKDVARMKQSLSGIGNQVSAVWDQGRFLFTNREELTPEEKRGGADKGRKRPIFVCLHDFHKTLKADVKMLDSATPGSAVVVDKATYILIRIKFVEEAQKLMQTNKRFDAAGLSGKRCW